MKKWLSHCVLMGFLLQAGFANAAIVEELDTIPVWLLQNKMVQERMSQLFAEKSPSATRRTFQIDRYKIEKETFFSFSVIEYPTPSQGKCHSLAYHFTATPQIDHADVIDVSELEPGKWGVPQFFFCMDFTGSFQGYQF